MSENTTIQVDTSRFGSVQVQKSDVIYFPRGIIGFPDLKKYVLVDHEKDSPFKWLQSLEDGTIAFVIVNPLLFKPDYAVEVTEAEVSGLDIQDEKDAVISVIVTIPSDASQMSANLKAPIVFNLENRHGQQIILAKADYQTRHKILDEVRGKASGKENKKLQQIVEAMQEKENKV